MCVCYRQATNCCFHRLSQYHDNYDYKSKLMLCHPAPDWQRKFGNRTFWFAGESECIADTTILPARYGRFIHFLLYKHAKTRHSTSQGTSSGYSYPEYDLLSVTIITKKDGHFKDLHVQYIIIYFFIRVRIALLLVHITLAYVLFPTATTLRGLYFHILVSYSCPVSAPYGF